MSDQTPFASAECIIHIDDAGLDTFHAFLQETWAEVGRQVAVNPEAEMAMSLMLGEIIANAARHAYADVPPCEQTLRIRLEVTPRCIRGEVWDHGREFPGAEERLRAAAADVAAHEDSSGVANHHDASNESGRGLRILTSLADTVRYERTDSGENAWFIGRCETPNRDTL